MSKLKPMPLSSPSADSGQALDLHRPPATSTVTALDRSVVRRVLQAMDDAPLAVVLWNGEELHTARNAPIARVRLRDRGALYRLLAHPELHFGDLYSVGRIEVEGNLVQFLEAIYRAGTQGGRHQWVRRGLARLRNRPRANTLAGSRDNIHHHYDLSNAFYALWLDETAMQYTCAYFPDPHMSLEAAQIAKMDHVARKLRLRAGESVVEAGCGWGGLARHLARHYGVRVRAYNISHEQVSYARERAKAEGLSDRVEYVEDDYRNVSGKYDVFVSVGMLEHVGRENYPELGEVIHRSLTDRGRGLIHSIGRNRPGRLNAWIERRIFPGGYPPSLREMMAVFEPRAFSVLDVENLRLHYAKTLEHWLERFERHTDRVREMFDERFVRAWRLYLAGSIAAFTTGTMQLFQVSFTRARNNDLPWNRAHLYRD